MARTRFLRTVIAGCTLALLAAASARGQAIHIPVPIPLKPKGPRIPVMGPLANQHLEAADKALVTMAQQLDEIASVKCDTDRSAVVTAWGTIVQAQRDMWSTEMQSAIEAGRLHMKQKGKIDQAVLASLNTQATAQLAFINSAFGTGGGMLAEWKLDFNQRMANMAMMEKVMPAVFKHLTTDMDEVQQKLKDIQASLDRPETSPSAAQGMMQRLDALKTRFDRVSRVVVLRQKVVEPYVKACAYPELKKKLDAILNIITPEQVAKNPSLASLPREAIEILLKWKTLLPKKCEDSYTPVWGSAQKAIVWVSDHNRLWNRLPFFRDAKTFGDADGLLTRAKAAAKEKVEAIKGRWSLLDRIKASKESCLRACRAEENRRRNLASSYPTKDLLELARKVKEAAEKAEKAGAAFPEARKFIEEQTQLVREAAALCKRMVEAYGSPPGCLQDELMAKVAKAPSKEAAEAMYKDTTRKILDARGEAFDFLKDNEDDMKALIDEGKLLLTLMK